jgi:hypothetical protein
MFSLLIKRNNYILKTRNILFKTSYSSIPKININNNNNNFNNNNNNNNNNMCIRLLSSYEGMSEIDIEKELFKIKRRMVCMKIIIIIIIIFSNKFVNNY